MIFLLTELLSICLKSSIINMSIEKGANTNNVSKFIGTPLLCALKEVHPHAEAVRLRVIKKL